MTKPVRELSGWVRGCDCHEAQLVQGIQVDCPWKGCRAPSFAARLQAFQDALLDMRRIAADVPGMGTQEVISALTTLIGFIKLKFQWVKEPPYTI